ncbi:MAG: hypothetical protein J7M40_14725, partial [Planctomycetes bacterium]|nr:hypothetical protein [Planctomycetota bacterium]
KGQSKSRGRKKTVRFRPFAAGRRASATRKKEVGYYQRLEDGGGSAKSKLAALWAPRVSLRLPYPVVACLLVAAAALLVAAVRFGQLNYDAGWLFFEPVAVSEQALDNGKLLDLSFVDPGKNDSTTVTDNETVVNDNIEDTSATGTQGTNAIVIQAYKLRRDLEPVKRHFEKNGIETQIVERGSFFLLRTKQLFHKCSIARDSFNPDYDGDVAMKEIRRIGALYKAPQGYESFRPNLFQDAYGEKVE